MNAKQKRFCDEYLLDCNATQAAIRAGYSEKTAYSQGSYLLKHPEVKAYVDEQLKKLSEKRTATAEEVMHYLTSVMRGESESEVIVIEGMGDGISKHKKVMKNPDEKEKLKAAELLAKRFGLLTDKLEVSAADEEKTKLASIVEQLKG